MDGMMKKLLLLFGLALFLSLIFFSLPVWSQSLEERVERLEKENQVLKDKVSNWEGKKGFSPSEPAASPARPGTFNEKDRETLGWLKAVHKRVQPFGNLAFRTDGQHYLKDVRSAGINFSGIDSQFQVIEAQVQLGLKGEIVDGLRYLVRLSTGGISPVGTWTVLDGFFDKDVIFLDRYYLDWQPTFFDSVQVLGGKFGSPMKGTPMVWDGDVGVQGVYILWDAAKHMNSSFVKKLGFGGLFYYLEEFTGDANDDVYALGPSLQSQFSLGNTTTLTFNFTYYDYHNIDGLAQGIGMGSVGTAQGAFATSNLTPIGPVNVGAVTPATLIFVGFASDFNLINPYLELETQLAGTPLKLWLEQIWNAGAAGIAANDDYGLMTGLKIGGTGKPGSWWGGYEYYYIEADATLDVFNDGQLGTNSTGHILSGGITLAKNVDLFTTLNFHQDINPFFRGFGDTIGAQIPGILVPINDDPWMIRPRVFLTTRF